MGWLLVLLGLVVLGGCSSSEHDTSFRPVGFLDEAGGNDLRPVSTPRRPRGTRCWIHGMENCGHVDCR